MHLSGQLRASNGGFTRLCGGKKVTLQLIWHREFLAVTQGLLLARGLQQQRITVLALTVKPVHKQGVTKQLELRGIGSEVKAW